MLEARNLGYAVPEREILRDIGFKVEPGRLTVLIGPNGSGKSTLLKLLSGELEPTSGQVMMDGRPLDALSTLERARRPAVMSQSINVTFPFTSFDIVMMGRHPHISRRGETHHDFAVVDAALGKTEASPFRHRAFPTLSGGEQARVVLARALAQEAPILLLDEPTAHLDLRHQHAVLALGQELAAAGAAVLVILHDINLAALYADAIGIMHQGRMRAFGAPEVVLNEGLLSEVFQMPFQTLKHPSQPRLMFLPITEPDSVRTTIAARATG